MFEKSLYDLIKGLRNHRGAEEDYIQNSLRECKTEIKSQDMDKKATALLKLIYLEMFGYDMSWASFHVLEVMSCTKYLQKRVGYLGAVQSFRSDTEVLMLATNLLKKDIISSSIPNMSLPLITLPHIITPSLAISLLGDILPRLSHSHVVIRKKAVVCLYRLALIYPEALKIAWPKIKDRLMDDEEDSSVITAVVNVVCELGWRRPHDFLPLAPRFFDLLVEGGNNWMAIKIIKLFATLTPIEPRLIRKLLRPLTNIIQTTTAMSLLYECINGIVQCGILDGEEALRENSEIASVCVGKLRGMIVTDSDPNLKYVALLAFNRIVISHPVIVSMQQDVIMDCLEDADVSIRLQALELAARMVTSETLQSVVDRLVDQLGSSTRPIPESLHSDDEPLAHGKQENCNTDGSFTLPIEYRNEVLHRILDICSHDNYSELPDFEWYIDILVRLVKLLPPNAREYVPHHAIYQGNTNDFDKDIAFRIGYELRNVAVRVKTVRMEATRAAESLMLALFSTVFSSKNGILGPLAWITGEYAGYLLYPSRTLQSLIEISNTKMRAKALSLCLQAIPKVLVRIINDGRSCGASPKGETALLLARVIKFLEALATHPDLDVQERALEFLEIFRLASEAIKTNTQQPQEMPFLLSSVIPGLFSGLDLNPVAATAQRKVPLPEKLILDQTLNSNLSGLFDHNANLHVEPGDQAPLQKFYYIQEHPEPTKQPFDAPQLEFQLNVSYQNLTGVSSADETAAVMKRKAERRENNRDDPFYIGIDEGSSGISTPFHQVFNASNGTGLDVDSIPIIDLKLNEDGDDLRNQEVDLGQSRRPRIRSRQYDIAADETIGNDDSVVLGTTNQSNKAKRALLQIDSSGLDKLSLGGDHDSNSALSPNLSRGEEDDKEMAKAMQEVERLRLKMQRASERIHPEGIPAEGMVVRKKRKEKKPAVQTPENGNNGVSIDKNTRQDNLDSSVGKKKRKTKRQPATVLE